MSLAALKTIDKTWPSVAEYLSVPHNEEAYRRLVDYLVSDEQKIIMYRRN